uniref:Laminin G domain-containing protein n=1 Tax=Zosterops lateralis melanops TaxID=1220523 RepID=A0A8D2PT16_ZOSLA
MIDVIFLCVRGKLPAEFWRICFVELIKAEASPQTSLQLQFRTSKPQGLLFLAAGKTDYCLLELHSGYLKFCLLQARINFGAGERVLHSQRRSQLNDSAFRLVELHHEQDNVTLVIDKNDRTSTKMPGILYELNIDYGFYIGGTGKLDVPYIAGALPGFRGCIDGVSFNQLDILMPLRPSPGFKNIHEVSGGCSDEFFAGEEVSINFFSSRSYISFPSRNVDDEGIFEFTLQTSAASGLLLYHPGQAGDFIAMEMKNETVKKSLPPQSKLPLLKESFFVGGVDDNIRSEVIKLISRSGKYTRGRSFKGCLRNLKANSEKKSLKNVLVTKDISAGCEMQSSFKTNLSLEMAVKNPAVKAAPMFAISHESPISLRKEDKSHLLVLSNLIVLEGGQASLESKHIKVNLDFQKLGISQSQIIFDIKEPPSHGHLKLNIQPLQEVNTFTMQDVWQGKILYVHDGSEDTYDYFDFSISISSEKIVSAYLEGNEQHMFSITVTPVNDAPEIKLPKLNLLCILENSKKRLTNRLIKVQDNDTDSVDIRLSVLGNLSAGYLENSGHCGTPITTFTNEDLNKGTIFFVHTGVKNSRIILRANDGEKMSKAVVLRVMAVSLDYRVVNNSGINLLQGVTSLIRPRHLAVETVPQELKVRVRYEITEPPHFGQVQRQNSKRVWEQVNSFSQLSLQRGCVRYYSTFKHIQLENVTDHFKFKVSTENRISEEHTFPIEVKWLRYSLLKHAPLEIEKSQKKYLNSGNLFAVIVDLEVPEDEIHFKLLSLPKNGQILLNDQPLKNGSVFSQKDITDQKVAYELIQYHEDYDSFRFLISTKYLDSNSYDFEICIKSDFRNIILTNNSLNVTEGEGELITSTKLFVQTPDNKTFEYEVIQFPKHGKLKLTNFSGSLENNGNPTTFTNKDITDKCLMYVHDDSETTFDEFLVRAFSRESGKGTEFDPEVEPLSVVIRFCISVQLKNDEKPVRVIDKIFDIVRNGQRLLTLADLCYHDPDSDFDDGQLLYIRRGISNGDLVLTNDTLHRLYRFKQVDLDQKQVLFIHHGADFGRFVLFVTDGKHYTSLLLEINATDPYVRLANNTGLLVQKGKEETISTANLSSITNQDIRNDHEVTYEILSFPKYGRIYVNNVLMDSFTQLDLIKGHVTYRHDDSSNLIDTFNFTIRAGGVHLDAGLQIRVYLESQQQPPRIVNKNSLLVEEGKPVKISKGKLQVVHESSSPSEIVFTVRQLPVQGYIWKFSSEESYLSSDQRPALTFTQQDVDEGKVRYVQTVSDQLEDHFFLDVTNGVRTVNGIEISVDIIPRMIPFEVQNFTVFEGGSKALVEDYLKILSRHFAGLSCEFILTEQPKHRYVENSRVPGIKLIFLDVIVFSFLPGAIVQEGGRVLINKTNLDASNLLIKLPDVQRSMYEVWHQVLSLPQHGMIVVGERNVTKEKPNFLQYVLDKFGITYIHDNSESLNDSFTFAVWLNLKSKPATKPHSEILEEMFNITVFPVNDQSPELKTKRLHLKVLQGDVSMLGAENLKVEDLDNAPAELKYTIVSNPNNDYLAMKSNLNVSIKDFTQADVDSGKVWFVQDGSSSSGVFYFSVTDGKHRPLYKLFSLDVIPIALVLVNLTNVVLPQGQTSVTITDVQLSAITNGKSTNTMYEITQPLKYGHLMIGNEQVTKFEQADLYSGRLSYHLTNLSASSEVLEFMLFTAEGNLTGQVLNITAKPLLQIVSDLQISNQAAYKFGSSDLDASELANLTNSNPRFEVIVPPSHGRIVKKRFVNDTVLEDTQVFTQADADNGVLLLDVDTNMTGIDLLNDSFTFVLRADAVQPAIGCFHFPFPFHCAIQSSTCALASSQNEEPEKAPQKTEPTMWPGQNPWENLHEEGPLLNQAVGTSISVELKTTNQVNARSPREQAGESNLWYIIIPLVLVSVLLIVAVTSVCILLMCQKKKKTKPVVKSQTDAILSSADQSSTFVAVKHEQLLPTVVSPATERYLKNSFLHLDPEMIQYCRKTNPTLKHNQYWV